MEGELEDFRRAVVFVFECKEGVWLAVRERTNEGSCEREGLIQIEQCEKESRLRWNEIRAYMAPTLEINLLRS